MLGLEADGTDLPEPGPKRTKPSQNDANNWEQNNQRIKIDKLVPELKRFLTEEDLYFYEPHKYVDTRPLDLPQFVTSTTENEIRARVAEYVSSSFAAVWAYTNTLSTGNAGKLV